MPNYPAIRGRIHRQRKAATESRMRHVIPCGRSQWFVIRFHDSGCRWLAGVPQVRIHFLGLTRYQWGTSSPENYSLFHIYIYKKNVLEWFSYACRVPVPEALELGETPDDPKQARMLGPWFSREVPMSFEVLFENLTDPSHVSFAHHGITPCARYIFSVRTSQCERLHSRFLVFPLCIALF